MGKNSFSTSFLPWLTLTVTLAVLCRVASSTDLGYECIYGPMMTTTTPEGETLEYCPTQMYPPQMNRGEYLRAVRNGICYECMCAPDIGLACCECPKPRRG